MKKGTVLVIHVIHSQCYNRIEKDEEILILLGGEGKLLGRILSQHGIFDCMTPDTSIPASMMSEWLALNALSESGHDKAKDSLTHQQNAHISKETYYSAYQAYFNRTDLNFIVTNQS